MAKGHQTNPFWFIFLHDSQLTGLEFIATLDPLNLKASTPLQLKIWIVNRKYMEVFKLISFKTSMIKVT